MRCASIFVLSSEFASLGSLLAISGARRTLDGRVTAGGAILRVNGFEKLFVGRPSVDLDFEFLTDARCDLRGHRAAQRGIESVAALQKRFDQVQLVYGNAAHVVNSSGIVSANIQKRAGGFDGLFVYDNGPGHKIAETFIFFAEKHAEHRDAVESGKLVDDAKKISRDGVVGANRAAVVLHHAKPCVALAGSLAVPRGFEKCEVAVVDCETRDNQRGDGPLRRDRSKNPQRWNGESQCNRKDGENHELNRGVHRERQEPAADSGKRKLQRRLLRRVDGKLVERLHL